MPRYNGRDKRKKPHALDDSDASEESQSNNQTATPPSQGINFTVPPTHDLGAYGDNFRILLSQLFSETMIGDLIFSCLNYPFIMAGKSADRLIIQPFSNPKEAAVFTAKLVGLGGVEQAGEAYLDIGKTAWYIVNPKQIWDTMVDLNTEWALNPKWQPGSSQPKWQLAKADAYMFMLDPSMSNNQYGDPNPIKRLTSNDLDNSKKLKHKEGLIFGKERLKNQQSNNKSVSTRKHKYKSRPKPKGH